MGRVGAIQPTLILLPRAAQLVHAHSRGILTNRPHASFAGWRPR